MNTQDLFAPHFKHEDAIRTLSSSTFSSLVLEGKGPIAVEFMSYGCAYCRALEPALQQVAQKVGANAQIFRVNIAVEEQLAADYGIDGTPTLVMFSNGQEVGRAEGPEPSVGRLLATITEPFES